MRIAIPLSDGRLSLHFGHCEYFAIVDVNRETGEILKRIDIEAPPHQPGFLPGWLAEKKIELIIAGGMGQRAKSLFNNNGIEVIVGAPSETPELLVANYIAGTLETGDNVCDH